MGTKWILSCTNFDNKFSPTDLNCDMNCNWAKPLLLNLFLAKSQMQIANYKFKPSIADLDCENSVLEDLTISFLLSMMEMNLENCFESMHSESNKGFKMNSLSAEHTKCEYVTALMSSKFLSIGIHFSPSLAIYLWETVMWGEGGKAYCSKL